MLRYLEPVVKSITAAAYLLLISGAVFLGYGAYRLVQYLTQTL